jgi:hypothetical protein
MKNHHNFRLPFSLAFFTFACLAFACFAADWPQFKRTPDRQGCNLAEQVTLPANLCAWADFGSPILGSPVVAAGRAYCMAQNGLIACIDLASNTVVWHRSLGGQSNECTPAVGNGKVYVGSTAGKFFVLDAADGAILEEHDVGGMVFAPVLLLNTGVYVGTYGGIFYAFDPDGNLKWTDTAQLNIKHGAAFGRGQIIYVDGNTNMVFLEDSGTYCKETRKITLELADNSSVTGWVNTPMVWRDTVFAAFSEAEMYYSQHNLLLYNIVTGAYIKYIRPTAAFSPRAGAPSRSIHRTLTACTRSIPRPRLSATAWFSGVRYRATRAAAPSTFTLRPRATPTAAPSSGRTGPPPTGLSHPRPR